ncbi:STAS/SEC14 domain-containing protein [Pyxidicoccus xibeiensis]|uniref:STAS/SEC14 domain-containing protein n=1 Tax=Pyxidicoccus xibeiensis TaxID=2906759 RepID=UPI0020A72B5D|nr:STAS/SEC14 domain-containing protein [Pyxidicoccus xibeiensis]MCP3141083.1 STAS/SEC14 domain-containing protein [Pyxidicoccus xibeiensis]
MGAVWTLGPHMMWFEEPDTVRVTLSGVYDMKLLEESRALVLELQKRHPTLYLIMDARNGAGMAADVRKQLSTSEDYMPYAASAMFGTGFAMRTMINMMVRAGSLLGRSSSRPFVMVGTEEEAKAWVAKVREADRLKQTA